MGRGSSSLSAWERLCVQQRRWLRLQSTGQKAGRWLTYTYPRQRAVRAAMRCTRGRRAANGKLTPIPGTPFQENVTTMAVNGKFLFGATLPGNDVNAYRIEPNGGLLYAVTNNITRYNSTDCASAGSVFTDRTGATIYNMEFRGDGCANNTYRSFKEESATGGLQNLGDSGGNSWLYERGEFSGEQHLGVFGVVPGEHVLGDFRVQTEQQRIADGDSDQRSGAASAERRVLLPVERGGGWGEPRGDRHAGGEAAGFQRSGRAAAGCLHGTEQRQSDDHEHGGEYAAGECGQR